MAIYFVVVILSAMMKRLVLKAFYAGTDHTIMVVSHWYKTMIPGQFTGGTNPFHMLPPVHIWACQSISGSSLNMYWGTGFGSGCFGRPPS